MINNCGLDNRKFDLFIVLTMKKLDTVITFKKRRHWIPQVTCFTIQSKIARNLSKEWKFPSFETTLFLCVADRQGWLEKNILLRFLLYI